MHIRSDISGVRELDVLEQVRSVCSSSTFKNYTSCSIVGYKLCEQRFMVPKINPLQINSYNSRLPTTTDETRLNTNLRNYFLIIIILSVILLN